MPSNVKFSLINTRCTAAAKVSSQRALMEHAKPRQLMDTKTCKKRLPTFMLDGTPDAPSNGSKLPQDQDSHYHLHPLGIVEAVFKTKKYSIRNL